jgi:ANTAR domain
VVGRQDKIGTTSSKRAPCGLACWWRALIEQAKGILMERHSTNADSAFDLLRTHSQNSGRKLVEIAEAVVESHLLLTIPAKPSAADAEPTL